MILIVKSRTIRELIDFINNNYQKESLLITFQFMDIVKHTLWRSLNSILEVCTEFIIRSPEQGLHMIC